MKNIDWTKPVRHIHTGALCRVLCTDADEAYPGAPVLVLHPGQGIYRCGLVSEGRFENVPETTVKFLNVYHSAVSRLRHSLAEAEDLSAERSDILGTLQLTFENDKLIGVEIVK
jgi:hypothetical protein